MHRYYSLCTYPVSCHCSMFNIHCVITSDRKHCYIWSVQFFNSFHFSCKSSVTGMINSNAFHIENYSGCNPAISAVRQRTCMECGNKNCSAPIIINPASKTYGFGFTSLFFAIFSNFKNSCNYSIFFLSNFNSLPQMIPVTVSNKYIGNI